MMSHGNRSLLLGDPDLCYHNNLCLHTRHNMNQKKSHPSLFFFFEKRSIALQRAVIDCMDI